MLGQQDGVGLVTFDDEPREWLPLEVGRLTSTVLKQSRRTGPNETDLGGVFSGLHPSYPAVACS